MTPVGPTHSPRTLVPCPGEVGVKGITRGHQGACVHQSRRAQVGEGDSNPQLCGCQQGPREDSSLRSGSAPLCKMGTTDACTSQEGQGVPLQEAQPENPMRAGTLPTLHPQSPELHQVHSRCSARATACVCVLASPLVGSVGMVWLPAGQGRDAATPTSCAPRITIPLETSPGPLRAEANSGPSRARTLGAHTHSCKVHSGVWAGEAEGWKDP